MDESWITLLMLGPAAGFMPLIFSLEIYVLGADAAEKKVTSLLGDITLFRLLVTLLVALLFTGMIGMGIMMTATNVQQLSRTWKRLDQWFDEVRRSGPSCAHRSLPYLERGQRRPTPLVRLTAWF
jgi:hypothetical protein